MRSHDLHATQQAALSPAARAVYERLVSGTYEIDLERLADALLARFETASACCALAAAGPGDEPLAAGDLEGGLEGELAGGPAVDPQGAASGEDAGAGAAATGEERAAGEAVADGEATATSLSSAR